MFREVRKRLLLRRGPRAAAIVSVVLSLGGGSLFPGEVQAAKAPGRRAATSARTADAATAPKPVTDPERLVAAIKERLNRVPEFEFIRKQAEKLGIRAWLFGGTAAGYAHYVNWDLQREDGTRKLQADRFDYDYTNIYRSTQDLDIVIDGPPEAARKLQDALLTRYPHFQGSKQAWEIRLLRERMGDKLALLENPDFLNQHTDSNSTGMIELTRPPGGESPVRDLRDWRSRAPHFLRDVAEGKLHYYFSDRHEETEFARAGRNPPILSAVRYLTKAFQYELELRPEDLGRIRKVVDEFDPASVAKNWYVAKWLEKNGKKLVQNAVDLEHAFKTLRELGLDRKLIGLRSDADVEDSLAWWLSKEPLWSGPVGKGAGKTAKALGLDVVAHDTQSFLAYEAITRAHSGRPNALISRSGVRGENAVHGPGFYVLSGRHGARSSDITIRFHLRPEAREGSDFTRVGDILVVKNRAALEVIPEGINVSLLEFLKGLREETSEVDEGDQGILEKFRRRVANRARDISPKEMAEIRALLLEEARKAKPRLSVFRVWLAMPISRQHLDIIELAEKNPALGETLILAAGQHPHWSDLEGRFTDSALRNGGGGRTILAILGEKPASEELSKKIVRMIDHLDPEGDAAVIEMILDQYNGQKAAPAGDFPGHDLIFERLAEKGTVDEKLIGILAYPRWTDERRGQWLDLFSRRGSPRRPELDSALIHNGLRTLGSPGKAEWVEGLMKRGVNNSQLVISVLGNQAWAQHPKWDTWVDQLMESGEHDEAIGYILDQRPESKARWVFRIADRVKDEAAADKGIYKGRAYYVDRRLFTALNSDHLKRNPELQALVGGGAVNYDSVMKAVRAGRRLPSDVDCAPSFRQLASGRKAKGRK